TLPVRRVLGEVEIVDVPDPLDRELVLPVGRALDHRPREVEAPHDIGVELGAVPFGHQASSSVFSTSVDMSMITSSSSKLPCRSDMCRRTASTSAASSGATMTSPQPASRHSY